MKICMIGTGYVGLVSGACFADLGNNVWCVDKNIKKINLLKNNKIPIFEPGLQEVVLKNHLSGRLKFTNDLKTAVINSDIIFICVGTPTLKNSGSADLKFVFQRFEIYRLLKSLLKLFCLLYILLPISLVRLFPLQKESQPH